MKKRIFILHFFIAILFIFLFTESLLAAPEDGGYGTQTVQLDNPLGEGNTNPNVLIGKVIEAVLGVVGSLALLMFIYGGFTWMLAAGNNERVQKGKEILIWATIGLVVIFSSYAMIKLIFQSLGIGAG